MSALNSALQSVGLVSAQTPRRSGGSVPLPLYSPVAPSEFSNQSEAGLDAELRDYDDSDELHPAQRHGIAGGVARAFPCRPCSWWPSFLSSGYNCGGSSAPLTLPSLARFLADFTLGFADGLTVPFALTAGLSSLGQTETVIYAGMAEICAGSISMGIGGYLSAKGENAAAARGRQEEKENEKDDVMEKTGVIDTEMGAEKSVAAEKYQATSSSMLVSAMTDLPEAATKYLAALKLPPQLAELVVAHVSHRPDVVRSLEAKAVEEDDEDEDSRLCSPVIVGLSVALGYLLGGLLPLFPYFVVRHVGDGLLWSFIVCIIALFTFGFSKDLLLNRQSFSRDAKEWGANGKARFGASSVPWKEIRHSVWEGIQMVILGSVAALAAVLCVRLFEGMHMTSDAS